MRIGLRNADTEYFIATFESCVSYFARNKKRYSFLFKNIMDKDGNILTDHIWVRAHIIKDALCGKKLKHGETIKIYADVDIYIKGYRGKKIKHKTHEIGLDYTIKNIEKIEVIN